MDSVSIATIIGTVIAAVGLPLAILQYNRSKQPTEIKLPPPVEEKENLQATFKMNQRLSLEIQQLLSDYILRNSAGQKLMFDNMTFDKYLDFVKNDYRGCLSDEVYSRIENTLLTRANIETAQKSLDQQNINLLNTRNQIKSLG